MSGFYHQDERDRALNVGALVLIAIIVAACLCAAACYSARADTMDGSSAGKNAVTAEQLQAAGSVAHVKREGEPPHIDRALTRCPRTSRAISRSTGGTTSSTSS